MHDEKDEIIYVGKAVSLKNRVRQYFQSSRNKGAKIEQMVTHIRRFEYIITDSELEALVLECNLIKEHRPKYNTMLMDDKAYPFIKVTVEEPYPRVMLARRMAKDKSRYFGPYTSAGAVKDTIELIRRLYHVRSCNRKLPRDIGKERPCLNYHIHQCKAPCQGYISEEEYRKSIQEVLRFLGGNYEGILKDLEEKMNQASEDLEFERAIEYRELLSSVQKIAQKQKITDTAGEDRDILAVASEGEDAVVQVFFIRGLQLRETVLCRDALYPRGDHAAGAGGGRGSHRGVAQWKTRAEGAYPDPTERDEGKAGGTGGEERGPCVEYRQRTAEAGRRKDHRRGEGAGEDPGTYRHPADGSLRHLQYQRFCLCGFHGGL